MGLRLEAVRMSLSRLKEPGEVNYYGRSPAVVSGAILW
jgi:hypothetical protein